MMRDFKRLTSRLRPRFLAVLLLSGAGQVAAERATFETGDGAIRDAGDWLQILLPATALGSTVVLGDEAGSQQYLWAFGSTLATVTLGKEVYGKLRPNTGSRSSFPSGHTAAAFSGASFIDARYGSKWGIPAYALAALTGYSRVWADAHFLDDVTAGASIGTLWSLFYASPYASDGNVAVMPMQAGADGYGLAVRWQEKAPEPRRVSNVDGKPGEVDWFSLPSRPKPKSDPKNRFTFGFGPAFLSKQEIKSPGSGGTVFDLNDFNKDDDPTSTAAVALDIDLKGKHSAVFAFWPFESRDKGKFATPVNFAGNTFPADTGIRSAWLMYDVRAIWNYDVFDNDDWNVDVGLGGTAQYLDIRLETTEGPATTGTVTDWYFLPLAEADATYKIAPKWSAYADVEGFWLSSDWILDTILALRYGANSQWGASIGWRHYSRDIET